MDLKTCASNAYPTTQVFDVYLFAVESIPGWWVFMDSIKPFVESMITDLEQRNPGMSFRTHWITKASFGRNKLYKPHINEAVDSYDRFIGSLEQKVQFGARRFKELGVSSTKEIESPEPISLARRASSSFACTAPRTSRSFP